jgi:LysR family transcriptional regulator, regulator for bpeEF and oprC
MKSLPGILSFIKTVDTGSFTRAAQQLDISPAAVSKNVARLEDHLATRLLNRTTRSLSMTEDGQLFYDRCRGAVRDLESADQALLEHRSTPMGLLRVSCSVTVGKAVILPLLPAFLAKYPQIQIELVFDDRFADLVVDRFDVALRGGRLPDSGMVARKIFSFNVAPYAAHSYLKRFGEPKTVDDLAHHNCLQFRLVNNNTLLEWELESSDKETRAISTSGNLILNDASAIVSMCAAGLGVALLADFLIDADIAGNQLKRILPDYARPPLSVYACYPSRKHAPLKTRVFVDYLASALKTASRK